MRRLPIRLAVAAALLMAASAVACTFGEVTVPRGESQVVVHAVLNPSYLQQFVLVERTLTGTTSVDTLAAFEPGDPIRTGRGIPVTGATVTLTGASRSLTAVEDRTTGSPNGTGVYRFTLPLASPLQPGIRYTLTVRTIDGLTVTGSTVIPQATAAALPTASERFVRDLDTLHLGWNAVPGARAYVTYAESPYGAFSLFGDSLTVRVPGMLRNIFAAEIPHVFIPGFRQEVVVAAVDTNYYDYFRSRNDPFTGSGIVNHLEGGVGLVGSVVPLVRRMLDVDATVRDPMEGRYVRPPGASQSVVGSIVLYVESPGVNGVPDALSGRWTRPGSAGDEGLLGTRDGKRVRLALLNQGSANDTIAAILAEWRGDTLVGAFERGGGIVLVRSR